MDKKKSGQLVQSAAEVYDEYFLPALFEQWAQHVVDAVGVRPGNRVLDVACGTGVVAVFAAQRTGSTGSIVGLDLNENMLEVARRKAPAITWRTGRAENLPYADSSFEAVTCQFGLMFFEEPVRALKEMRRVLRPGGKICVVVWDALEHTPGYAAMVDLLRRLFGEEVAAALRAPFILGDTRVLHSIFTQAGMPDARIDTLSGAAKFPSLESWIFTDIKGWTLADALDESQFARLNQEAGAALRRFVMADGSVVFDAPAHLIVWEKT